ncbi:hypothetical protein FACS1894171_1150 [Clostridia bacterium]|nr:hypothetical protein FACS1894171_1150 [Clostridia bacterium]
MNGSAVCAPIAMEFARQHLSFDDIAAEESATGWNTDNAYKLLITGEYQEPLKLTRADVPEQTTGEGNPQSTDVPHRDSFIIASKPVDLIIATEPSIDERELAHRYDVDLLAAPIAADAFVFITHRENPVNNLSTEQVRKIYTGEITNWKEVGGSDLEIVPYQRDRNSGSQTAMESMVMHDLAMMEPKTAKVRSISMSALTEAVAAEYDNDRQFAIGYSYKYYIDKLYINKDIKILSIDGIYPDNSAILSESYPFTAYYYAVIRGADRNELGGEFLDWIQSDEGRACITQAGYCPGCGHNALLKKIK